MVTPPEAQIAGGPQTTTPLLTHIVDGSIDWQVVLDEAGQVAVSSAGVLVTGGSLSFFGLDGSPRYHRVAPGDGGPTALDEQGNAYLDGFLNGSLDVGGPTPLTSSGWAGFVVSYDPSGAFRWAEVLPSTRGGNLSIAVSATTVAVGFPDQDTVDLGSGPLAGNGPYVAQLSTTTGDLRWAVRASSDSAELQMTALGPVTVDDTVTLAFSYQSSMTILGNTFNASGPGTLVAKIQADGSPAWLAPMMPFATASENRVGETARADMTAVGLFAADGTQKSCVLESTSNGIEILDDRDHLIRFWDNAVTESAL
jgi:hypothetical protein